MGSGSPTNRGKRPEPRDAERPDAERRGRLLERLCAPLPHILRLRTADQACAAAILFVSLLAIAGWWLYHGGHNGGLIDIDRAPRREVQFQVDVNTAQWPELALLPSVGKVLAQRIVESRETDGPFRDHDDLRRVKGIGPKTLARIKPYLLPIPAAEDVAGK